MVRSVNVGNVPKKKVYQKEYSRLRGVDFSTDPALVDESRSPWAPNMISDEGGYPVKRSGWHTAATFPARINGLFYYPVNASFLVHSGTEIYSLASSAQAAETLLFSGAFDGRSTSFYFEQKLYILTGENYLVYDGSAITAVAGFVPTTHIGMQPADGSGTFFEDINMLTGKRTNSFLVPSGGATMFVLDSGNIDAEAVTALVSGTVKTEGTDFTVNRSAGVVTFSEAIPDSNGIDTVLLTFSKAVPGARQTVEKCTVCSWFGMGNDSRVFFTGNPEKPHYDYASYLYDPSYFPASGWTRIGSDNSRIMGYIRQYNNQVIIKEDGDNQDATIYIRSAEVTADGEAVFPIQQGVSGVGAVSPRTFEYLRDDPLFLSGDGVNALTTSYSLGQQRTVQNRSGNINARLTAMNLDSAVSCVWKGYYLLSVGSGADREVFLADSRQRTESTQRNNNESFGYEWYHWNNVPARVWLVVQDELYFGTDDGKFCKFNTGTDKFVYSDDGQPVTASWSTKADDDGDFMLRKTMPKRGSGVMLKPYGRSSVTIYAVANINDNVETRTLVKDITLDIFDFNDIDFTRFSFRTPDGPIIIPFDAKIKKYSTLYFVFENKGLNEGFGIYGIIKRFVQGNYLKRGF